VSESPVGGGSVFLVVRLPAIPYTLFGGVIFRWRTVSSIILQFLLRAHRRNIEISVPFVLLYQSKYRFYVVPVNLLLISAFVAITAHR